jgi:hypothetical protein
LPLHMAIRSENRARLLGKAASCRGMQLRNSSRIRSGASLSGWIH